jgi:hypothetical protein
MNVLMKLAIVLLIVCVTVPAFAQANEDEDAERLRELNRQQQRVIAELFRDLKLQEIDEDENPLDQLDELQEQRRRVEEIQRRVLELQFEEPLRLRVNDAAEPVQLDAKPAVSPWADRSRSDVIAGLNDPSFAVRESATAYLLTDDTLTKDAIKALMREAKSPEQRQRLLRVAEHHVMRELRVRDFADGKRPDAADDGAFIIGRGANRPASVGYSYEPVLAHDNPQAKLPGVRVIATMPGFPGHAHLRRGDIIVQINGQGLSTHHREHDITNWVRWQIASRQAGDTIDFTVLRGGELVAIRMICAEGVALDYMYTTDAFETASRKEPYRRAWREAREELVSAMPKPKTLTPVPAE